MSNSIMRDALEEIALAGMGAPMQMSADEIQAWHASRAWDLIRIAAKALSADPEANDDAADLAILRSFVGELLNSWPDDRKGFDEFDVPGLCEKYGLMKPCADGETTRYVKQPVLLRALDAARAGEKP